MKKSEIASRVDEWILEQKYQEYAPKTLNAYRSRVQRFIDWLPDDEEITKDTLMRYKEESRAATHSANTVNAWLVSINKFLKWMNMKDVTVKKVKTQFKQSNEEVLSLSDYKRLLRFAKRDGKHQLYYIMKILAMTGIRIIELKFFTVENLKSNYILVNNKGKERKIIVRQDLMRELKHYAKEQGIKSGYLFPSPMIKGKMVNVSTIWRQMKKVAGEARVKRSKVHPHSYRHLFAQVFLNTYSDSITELADILGHNSLETTRQYTRTSDSQKKEKLEMMKFEKG